MPDLPEYVFSPGAAISERNSWENNLSREIAFTLDAHLDSLTAASFPQWARATARLLRAIPRIPQSFLNRILAAEPPDDTLSAKEVADRIAPTLATAAFNKHVLGVLAENGVEHKMWVTRRDSKVRDDHAITDKQVRAISQPFIVGGFPMQYPADSSTAPIRLWINDRCVSVGVRE